MKTSKTVKVDGKVYAKTMQFGNVQMLNIFKNKKRYDRKKLVKPADDR